MNRQFLALVVASLVGCDDTEDLTCEVLAAPDFCWTVGVAEAYACNAGANVSELSADGKTCSLDGKTTAEFTPAVIRPYDIQEIKIVVSDAEGTCATLVDDHVSMITLKTKSGSIDVHSRPADYWVACPNGTTYATDDPTKLLSCGGGTPDNARLPGVIKSDLSFALTPRPEGPPYLFVDCVALVTP